MKKLFLSVMIILPTMLLSQTVSGLKVETAAGSPSTVTFNVSWDKTAMPALWSDTVWVFVDYNKNGAMTRLPLLSGSGATLTATSSPGVGALEEVSGNDRGVWIVGDARTNGSFSATVQLLTAAANLNGACAYASSYPPVGAWLNDTKIAFTGTPVYEITLGLPDGGTETTVSGNLYLLSCGYNIISFTDATGAPGVLVPATYTLSGENVCEGTDVTLTLWDSQFGWRYQLYRDGVPVGTVVDGTGSPLVFTDTPGVGYFNYTVWTVANPAVEAQRAMQVSNTLHVTVHPLPTSLTFVSTLATVCEGESVTLVALPAGAASYSIGSGWQASNTFSFTPSAAATYTLYIQTAAGCTASATGAVVVALNPLPAVPTGASADSRCGAGTVTFSATVPSGHTIDWYTTSNGTTLVSGGGSVTSFSPSINASTTYYAQARNTTTGCISASRTAVLATMNGVPGAPSISGSSSYCTSGVITASAGSGGTGIRWTDGGSGSTTATRTITASGTYYAVSTNAAGCTSTSTSKVVTIVLPGTSGSSATACDCASGLTKCSDNICRTGCPPTQVSSCPNGQSCMLVANNYGIDRDWGVSGCVSLTPWGMSCFEIAVALGASSYVWDGTNCRICK